MASGPRSRTMRQLVIEADPDWLRDSRNVIEYEFNAEDGVREFKGDYQARGPYGEDEE